MNFCGIPGAPSSVMFIPGAPGGSSPLPLPVYIYPTIMFAPQRAVVFTPL